MSAVPITGESGVHEYGLGKDASVWLLVSITQGQPVSRIKRLGSQALRQL